MKMFDMGDCSGVRINVLRQKVYKKLIEQLKNKFNESEYAEKYSVTYSITTDRIQSELIVEDEGHYYDSLEVKEGDTQNQKDSQSDDIGYDLSNDYPIADKIEQAIIDIYDYAYLGMDEYGEIIRLIQKEVGRLVILSDIIFDTVRSEIFSRLRTFERLNRDGFIRDKEDVSAYISNVKAIDFLSKSVVNKVSVRDIDIIQYGFHGINPANHSLNLSCLISYGDPYIRLIDFTLAVFLIFVSNDVIFRIDRQGTKRYSENDTQITIFARFIEAVVNSPIHRLQRPDFVTKLNGILKEITGEINSPIIIDAVIKIKFNAIRHRMEVSSLAIVKEYFQPTNMFGFYKLNAAKNKSVISNKTELTLGLVEDVMINDKYIFKTNPLKYLNKYISRIKSSP